MNCLKNAIFLSMCLTPILCAAQTTQPLDKVPAAQLIDRLREIHSFNEFNQRMCRINLGWSPEQKSHNDESAKLHGPPTPTDAAEELVRRGIDAMPDLIAHLGDARKTGAIVDSPMNGPTYSLEFDRSPRMDRIRPPNLYSLGDYARFQFDLPGEPTDNPHILAVGDLCFAIVGRIVNRQFYAVRCEPEAMTIVVSPVYFPDVRHAVVSQWGNLTAAQLRQSLINDVAHPDHPYRAMEGVWTLYRYFPADVPAAVHDRFNLPLYDWAETRDFLEESVYCEPDAARRKQLITSFCSDHEAGSKDGIIMKLWQDRTEQLGQDASVVTGSVIRATPASILAQLIGNFDPDYPPATNAGDYGDLEEFLGAISVIPSKEVSAEIYTEFQRLGDYHGKQWSRNEDLDAQACVKALVHKGYDEPLRAWCQRRMREAPADAASFQDSLDELNTPAKSN